MIRRLHTFLGLPFRQKLLLFHAWCLLGWYRAALLLVSFKRLVAGLRHHPLVPPTPLLPEALQEEAASIGRLVAAAGRVTPWRSPCLAQVLAAQHLLAARGIPGQFSLGVRRGREGTEDHVGLAAHAWLQCGDTIVNGAAGHEQYTVVSIFSWGGVGMRERLPAVADGGKTGP